MEKYKLIFSLLLQFITFSIKLFCSTKRNNVNLVKVQFKKNDKKRTKFNSYVDIVTTVFTQPSINFLG